MTNLPSPTDEMLNIIEAVKKIKKIKVIAKPGSGKTTLLKIVANEFGAMKCCYLAYNSSIVKEVKGEFPTNTLVKTGHSLAYNWYKPKARGKELTNNIRPIELKTILSAPRMDYNDGKMILDILENYLLSDDTNHIITDIHGTDRLHTLKPREIKVTLDYTNKLLGKMRDDDDPQNITHSFYLKEFHLAMLAGKVDLAFDILMMDEAQDASVIARAIFSAIKAKRKIVVGDPDQRLYSFIGAVDALGVLEDYTAYPLTKSWRLPPSIAENATNFISVMKADTIPIIGMAKESDNTQPTDSCIISRTNSMLIEKMLSYLDSQNDTIKNGWVTVRAPSGIFSLAMDISKATYMVDQEDKTTYDVKPKDFTNKFVWFLIKDFMDATKAPWMAQTKHLKSIGAKAGSKPLFSGYLAKSGEDDREMKSTLNVLRKFADSKYSLFEVYNIAKQRYADKVNTYPIKLTTAHTSKGLEFGFVKLAEDFPNFIEEIAMNIYIRYNAQALSADSHLETWRLLVAGKAISEQLVDELNLIYVAMSRAKATLHTGSAGGVFDANINKMMSTEEIDSKIDSMLRDIIKNGGKIPKVKKEEVA